MAGLHRTLLILYITVLAVSQGIYGQNTDNKGPPSQNEPPPGLPPVGTQTKSTAPPVMKVPPISPASSNPNRNPTQSKSGEPPVGTSDQNPVPPEAPNQLSTTGEDLTTLPFGLLDANATTTLAPVVTTSSKKTVTEPKTTAKSPTTKPPSTTSKPPSTKPPSTKPPSITAKPTTEPAPKVPPHQETPSPTTRATPEGTTKHHPKDTKTKANSQGVTSPTENTSSKIGDSSVWVDKNSFTAKVLLPIAAGVILAVFIVLVVWSIRSCLNRKGNGSRKRLMDHDMAPTDRVMLLADSSEDEF